MKFEDFDTERFVLASCLLGPEGWRNFPEAWLKSDLSRKTYREFQKFLKPPYQTIPSADTVIDKVSDPEVKLFVKELQSIKVEPRDTNVKLVDLFEMYAARKCLDVAESITNDIEKTKIQDLVRNKISMLADLVNPFEAGQRKRGFIYESAKQRWQQYRDIEKNSNLLNKLPFHISELDTYTNGGLGLGHILLLFASTGAMKTKTKANLAYNFAFVDKRDVMVLTLEVPKDDYEHIIDSRHNMLEFGLIQTANLGEKREQYRQSLVEMDKAKPPLYIVDIPGGATSADIISELELYYVRYGKYPDVVVMDYVNEMEPVTSWKSTGEKYKNLGVEIRRIVRSYGIRFVTSMQENREGKKIKNKEKEGLEHIGESHSFSNVCHVVVHLYQDEEGIDEIENTLHWRILKNRYGKKGVSFSTFANPAINYVGDRRIVRGVV